MIRLAKLTDYGIVLLTYFTRGGGAAVYSARALAEESHLSVPLVSKLLKLLARHGILESARGKNGGYRLSRCAEDISLAEVIRALEGPIGLTECVEAEGVCRFEVLCPVRGNWQIINEAVHGALSRISLSQMRGPLPGMPVASLVAHGR